MSVERFRQALLEAPGAEDIYKLIAEWEAKLGD